MPENGREKRPHIPKMAKFLEGGKNGHFAKAIVTQNPQEWPTLGMNFDDQE